jgi:hypothetical protein
METLNRGGSRLKVPKKGVGEERGMRSAQDTRLEHAETNREPGNSWCGIMVAEPFSIESSALGDSSWTPSLLLQT